MKELQQQRQCYLHISQSKKKDFIVDDKIFPQTLEVLQTRARPLGINIVISRFRFKLASISDISL